MARAKGKAPSDEADVADVAQHDAGPTGIDAVLVGLEGVVAQLERGDLPLEQALERFEQGVALARRGGRLLDAVEERVERLLADRDETVPFETEDEK
jgi:exodeoxyribonuclease VII small subunit